MIKDPKWIDHIRKDWSEHILILWYLERMREGDKIVLQELPEEHQKIIKKHAVKKR